MEEKNIEINWTEKNKKDKIIWTKDAFLASLLELSQGYLKYRGTIFYIFLIVLILSTLISFISLWWGWILAFFLFILWLFKQFLVFLYNLIPFNFWFNIWLNLNNNVDIFLLNIFIFIEFILKLFLVLVIYKFISLYFKKDIFTTWNIKDKQIYKWGVNLLVKFKDFFNWKINYLVLFDILKEFISKYFIPVSWTIVWIFTIYLFLNSNNVNAKIMYNDKNNKEQTKIIEAKNNLELLKKIEDDNNIIIKENNLLKLENEKQLSEFDKIFLYYITKNNKYLSNINNKKKIKRIKDIKNYPQTVIQLFNDYKKWLEKNTYYFVYNKLILSKIIITKLYFDWKTFNPIFKKTQILFSFSFVYILIMLLWLDIWVILLFKHLILVKKEE